MFKTISTLLFFLLALCAPVTQAHQKQGVEFDIHGGSPLAHEFVSSIEKAIEASGDFKLETTHSKRNIQLIVPSIYWTNAQSKVNFHAVVLFVRGKEYLGISDSACWSNEMARCAGGVLRDLSDVLNADNKGTGIINRD